MYYPILPFWKKVRKNSVYVFSCVVAICYAYFRFECVLVRRWQTDMFSHVLSILPLLSCRSFLFLLIISQCFSEVQLGNHLALVGSRNLLALLSLFLFHDFLLVSTVLLLFLTNCSEIWFWIIFAGLRSILLKNHLPVANSDCVWHFTLPEM